MLVWPAAQSTTFTLSFCTKSLVIKNRSQVLFLHCASCTDACRPGDLAQAESHITFYVPAHTNTYAAGAFGPAFGPILTNITGAINSTYVAVAYYGALPLLMSQPFLPQDVVRTFFCG